MTNRKILPLAIFICLISNVLISQASADVIDGHAAYNAGDFKTASKEFREAANRGDRSAQSFLGLMYAKG